MFRGQPSANVPGTIAHVAGAATHFTVNSDNCRSVEELSASRKLAQAIKAALYSALSILSIVFWQVSSLQKQFAEAHKR